MNKYKVTIKKRDNIKVLYINEKAILETNLSSVCGICSAFIEEKLNNIDTYDIELLLHRINEIVFETLDYKQIDGIYFKSFIDKHIIDSRVGREYDYKRMFLINWRIMQLLNIGLKNYEEYLKNKPVFLSDEFIKEINDANKR